MSDISIENVREAEYQVALAALAAGASPDRIVGAAQRDVGSLTAAALAAKNSGAISISKEHSGAIVELLVRSPSNASAVGVGATQQDIFAMLASVRSRPADLAFRVTDVNAGVNAFTIDLIARSGDARYEARDALGALVGTSSGSSITISGLPRPVAISAVGPTGQILETIQFKINDYEAGIEKGEVIAATGSGEMSTLSFLGSARVPRLVERVAYDPISAGPAPLPERLAITCQGTYTDASLSARLEYRYVVTPLSGNPGACGAMDGPVGEADNTIGALTVPATELGLGALGSQGRGGVLMPGIAASQSVLEVHLAGVQSPGPGEGAAEPQAAGDDWAPVVFRYQTFISKRHIYSPGFTGDVNYPYQYFSGDGRGFDPKGSYRFRQDIEVRFGAGHSVSYSESVGTTTKWACESIGFYNCLYQQQGKARLDELHIRDVSHGNTWTNFRLNNDSRNPLHALAPGISSNLVFGLREGGSTIRGTHDLMPRHEIYFTVVGWNEWYRAYANSTEPVSCLARGSFDLSCRARLNIRL